MRADGTLALCVLAMLCAAPVVADDETFLDSQVTIATPEDWIVIDSQTTDTSFRRTFLLPGEADSSDGTVTNLRISGRLVPPEATARLRDTLLAGRAIPGFSIRSEADDGPYWKNYLWTAQLDGDGEYVGIERIGMRNGVLIDLLLCFPLRVASGDSADNNRQITFEQVTTRQRRAGNVTVDKKGALQRLRAFNALAGSVVLVKPEKPRLRFILVKGPAAGAAAAR